MNIRYNSIINLTIIGLSMITSNTDNLLSSSITTKGTVISQVVYNNAELKPMSYANTVTTIHSGTVAFDFIRHLSICQKDLEPEFAEVLHDNFWDLI